MPENRDRTVFVAGASGVIGIRLCWLLVQDGWSVVGTTRSPHKTASLSAIGVEPVVVDVFDRDALLACVLKARPRIVVHQLTDLPDGLDPGRMAEARARNAHIREAGTRNLVAAAATAGIERMVAQSIAFAYAPGPLPYREDAPLNFDEPAVGLTARGVASLEEQVLTGPFTGIVLRYGKLYGPGTGFDAPAAGGALHVDAAADAARRAMVQGDAGIYNVAEDDGTICSDKAARQLAWDPAFRIGA